MSDTVAESDTLSRRGAATERVRRIPLDAYPYVAEHYEQHVNGGPRDGVRAFELALDLLLE